MIPGGASQIPARCPGRDRSHLRLQRRLRASHPERAGRAFLAPRLHAAIGRVLGLLPLTRAHYYHAEMHGSWSIKAVLPTIAPELAYADLDVADGGMAQQAYREMIHPTTSVERRAALRRALLAYCERDTMALVRLVRISRRAVPLNVRLNAK
jgi:hypothetical protein